MDNAMSQTNGPPAASPVLVAVEDLIFLSKIQQTARDTGIAIEPVGIGKLKERLQQSSSRAVIVDLNHRSGKAVEATRAIKSDPATSRVFILGFLSHVQADLAREARQARLDAVMARSAFSEQLPELLRAMAKA
jgi:DNA-binding NarL/FixJ family response regulator